MRPRSVTTAVAAAWADAPLQRRNPSTISACTYSSSRYRVALPRDRRTLDVKGDDELNAPTCVGAPQGTAIWSWTTAADPGVCRLTPASSITSDALNKDHKRMVADALDLRLWSYPLVSSRPTRCPQLLVTGRSWPLRWCAASRSSPVVGPSIRASYEYWGPRQPVRAPRIRRSGEARCCGGPAAYALDLQEAQRVRIDEPPTPVIRCAGQMPRVTDGKHESPLMTVAAPSEYW